MNRMSALSFFNQIGVVIIQVLRWNLEQLHNLKQF